ncbi:MAG TPA: flippase activity-associated protein Agl23 [Candidatus Latescibacteria bacterium]|nr:flippase activity-associated protein Agl23 [Candidatus Latescibacterota bacterium]
MTNKAFRGLFFCAVLGALLFRVVRLDVRPMHHDEANQALKFGDLLERGEYRFDPSDHHGPSLYYLTLPMARVAGERTLAGLDETTLRLVPALFGAGLLLLFLLFAGGLSRETILAAAALAAVSPAMTYYSRFYIQEILLVFFLAALIAAGWRYAQTRSAWWALAAGVSAGMMYATKETSVILFGALAAALGLVLFMDRFDKQRNGIVRAGDTWVWREARTRPPTAFHAALFLIAGAVTAVVFYTSFFQNTVGLLDSVRAIAASFNRAGHPGFHAHPWYSYFQTLAYSKTAGGPVWSEALLLFLAAVGGIAAFRRDAGKDASPRFVRFVLFFTIITATVYSLIPYKTPWNILPFYFGFVVLAGNGVGLLLRVSRFRLVKILILAVLVPGFVNLAIQAYRADFIAHSDPANPYVYAQTSPDFLKLVAAVEKIAAASPEKKDLLIKVVAPPDETWPLPWYLRSFGRVGYWTSAEAAGAIGDAAVVIASAANVEKVAAALGDGYQQEFYGLRPEVVLSLFIRRDLMDLSTGAGPLR